MTVKKMGRKVQNWALNEDGQLVKVGDTMITVPSDQDTAGVVETGKTFAGAPVLRQTFSGTRAATSAAQVTEALIASGVANVLSAQGSVTLAGGDIVAVGAAQNDGTDHQESAVIVSGGALNLVNGGAPAVATYEMLGWNVVVEYTLV